MAIRARAGDDGARTARGGRRQKSPGKLTKTASPKPPKGAHADEHPPSRTVAKQPKKASTSKRSKAAPKRTVDIRSVDDPAPSPLSPKLARTVALREAGVPQGFLRDAGTPHRASSRRSDHIAGPPTPEILCMAGMAPDVELENLDWDDAKPGRARRGSRAESAHAGLVTRWVERGQELLAKLTLLEADNYEYRADLRDGRFVWLAPDGTVAVKADAKVLCSWARSTSVVVMAWVDPLLREVAITRVESMPAELDDVDEAGAWHVAMRAAEACSAQYIYRVPTPHASYFVALWDVRPAYEDEAFCPGTPVGLVLRGLGEIRQAIESRAEPADVVRERLANAGGALLYQADYAYRDTDWVTRLRRTGQTLSRLSRRLARPTFSAIAAGRCADEWMSDETSRDLASAMRLLEDEWAAFG